MTNITAAPVVAHGVRVPTLLTLALALGRGLGRLLTSCGRVLVDLLTAYASAQEFAYANPARNSTHAQAPASDADLEGRDPSW